MEPGNAPARCAPPSACAHLRNGAKGADLARHAARAVSSHAAPLSRQGRLQQAPPCAGASGGS